MPSALHQRDVVASARSVASADDHLPGVAATEYAVPAESAKSGVPFPHMPVSRPASCHHSRQLFIVVSALALASLAAGCRSTPTTSETAASSDTWAVVDGREITRDTVEKAYRRTRDASQPLSEEEALTAKLSLLNDLI